MSLFLKMDGNWKKFSDFKKNTEIVMASSKNFKQIFENFPFILEQKVIGETQEIEALLNDSVFEDFRLLLNKAFLSSFVPFEKLCVFETELLFQAKLHLKNLGY